MAGISPNCCLGPVLRSPHKLPAAANRRPEALQIPWTIFLAASDLKPPLRLSRLTKWPQEADDASARLHFWGRRLHCPDNAPLRFEGVKAIAVFAISLLVETEAPCCSGLLQSLLPARSTSTGNHCPLQSHALRGVHCLSPGCRHAPQELTSTFHSDWPFCSTSECQSAFYPISEASAVSAVWILFQPAPLLALWPREQPALSGRTLQHLHQRIGPLPFALLHALRPHHQHQHHHHHPPTTEPTNRHSVSLLSEAFSAILHRSYLLLLLRRYLQAPFYPHRAYNENHLNTWCLLLLSLLLLLTFVVTALLLVSPATMGVHHLSPSASTRGLRTPASHYIYPPFLESTGTCAVALWTERGSTITQSQRRSLFDSLQSNMEVVGSELTRVLQWLGSGKPAGLKINRHLAALMSRFFLAHIQAWRVYVSGLLTAFANLTATLHACLPPSQMRTLLLPALLMTAPLLQLARCLCSTQPPGLRHHLDILLAYASFSLRLAAVLFICLSIDLCNLATIHLSCFYVYTVRLFRLQLTTVLSAWRLCRSRSKWNPLRQRVDSIPDSDDLPPATFRAVSVSALDSCEVVSLQPNPRHSQHLDRMFVATFLGVAIGLCLLPTTFAFYATFSSIYLCMHMVKLLLTRAVHFLLTFPAGSILDWLLNNVSCRSELDFVAPALNSCEVPFLLLKVVRCDFWTNYRRSQLFDTSLMFGPELSLFEIFKHLFCAKMF